MRLNSNGEIDNSFTSGITINKYVFSIALQQDGKIIIFGDFTDYNGVSRKGIARLSGLTISGFPANITIQASGSNGETASRNLTLTVNQ